jgi:hypothetical protein
MRKGFKLVFNNGLCLTSMNCPRDGEVEYSTTKWTRPREGCGPLFVYKLLLSAQKSQNIYGGEVWECEYVPFKGRLRQTPSGPLAGWVGNIPGVYVANLTKVIRLASRVKLVRRVS